MRQLLVAVCALVVVLPAPVGAADEPVGVTFDSVAFGAASTLEVWLPDGYQPHGRAWPVVYLLHGGSPRAAVDAWGLADLQRDFVVVAPDLEGACASCVWVDGTVDGETYLLGEVVPLVEERFNVVAERAGRALLGGGMGGTGALIQAFRHPDTFAFVGAVGPRVDLAGGPASDYDGWLAGQGVVTEIARRGVSPLDLAPQVVTANVETVVVSADRANTGPAAVLAELGLPHRFVTADVSAADALRAHLLEPLRQTFAEPLPAPHEFSYKSVDRAFTVWGYDVAVQRPNTEFLNVLGARLDGRDLILAGTGAVTVTTPPAFTPHSRHEIVTTRDPRQSEAAVGDRAIRPLAPAAVEVVADAGGRVTFTVPLGATRPTDELEALVNAGRHEVVGVRVEVDPQVPAVVDRGDGDERWLYRQDLPAPFDAWNVSVTPWEDNPQALTVDFDSPALGLRARSYVTLPDAYLQRGGRFPVLYFLHGTAEPAGTSGKWQSLNVGFHEPANLARQQFLVVSPDMNEAAWCGKCWWIDRNDPPTDHPSRFPVEMADAETHLYDELVPLVEAVFRVRDDRGGRGIIGNSMGASGAFLHAARHPDRWAFAGGFSGLQDVGSEYSDPGGELTAQYTARQGYPRREAGEAHYRNISPLELAPQLAQAGVGVVMSAGDGCIDFASSANRCQHAADTLFVTEAIIRRDNDHVSALWNQLGVAHFYGTFAGTHYWPDPDVYEAWFLDRINATFAAATPDPFRISYKTTDREFSAWGYDVAVARPNLEFCNLVGARLDGRAFTLAGTGVATVTTPPAFVPHRPYDVVVTDAAGAATTTPVTADAEGRIRLDVPLAATRTTDERHELVEAGLYPFAPTSVRITP